MNKVLLFAGTTEGKEVAEFCKGKNIDLTVSVATEYGEATMTEGKTSRSFPDGRTLKPWPCFLRRKNRTW